MTTFDLGRFGPPFDQLLQQVPQLAPIYAEHVDDNGDVLPHVLMGDVARLFNAQLSEAVIPGPGADPAEAVVRAVLGSLELSLANGGSEVEEVVSASFLENLDQGDDEYEKARSLMGPRLLALLERIESD